MTDAELLRRVQEGDHSAWGVLYERYLPTLWRYVCARVPGDRHLAEDVVSETMLALVRAIGSLDPEGGSLSGWLLSVARNKLNDQRRKARRAERVEGAVEQHALSQQTGLAETSSVEAAETRARVLAVMDRLPDEERLVLEWKYLEDLSVREIAARIGRTEKAAESILYRARRSFRSLLDRVP